MGSGIELFWEFGVKKSFPFCPSRCTRRCIHIIEINVTEVYGEGAAGRYCDDVRKGKVVSRKDGRPPHSSSNVKVCYIIFEIREFWAGDFVYKRDVKVVSSEEVRKHPHPRLRCYSVDVNTGNFRDIHPVRELGIKGCWIRRDFPPLCFIRLGRLRDRSLCRSPVLSIFTLLLRFGPWRVSS